MRRLSTLSPKTTSTSGDDVNVNVNAQYNVNHLTVTPQLHLHLHLHLGIQFYLTAPQLPSSPYMSPTHGPDARDERSRRRPEAAEGAVVPRRYERVSSLQVRFAAAFRVTSSLLYFYFYICGLVFAARCALPAVRSRAQGRSRPPWSMWTMHPHLDQSRRRVTLPASAHATALLRRPGALPRWSCTAQAPPSSARPNGLARALGYRYLIRKVPNLEGAPSLVPLGSCPLSPPRSSFVRLPRFASPVPRSPLRTAQAFVSPGGGALRDPSISRKWRSSRACACECAESDWVAPRMACTIASARCCTARISLSLLA